MLRISQSKKDLQLFIDRNPDNVHVREARQMIDSLDFETAKMMDTMESYKKYMEDHEQGFYYDEAKSAYDRLEEEMVRAAQLKAEQDSIAKAAEAAAELLLNVGQWMGERCEEVRQCLWRQITEILGWALNMSENGTAVAGMQKHTVGILWEIELLGMCVLFWIQNTFYYLRHQYVARAVRR